MTAILTTAAVILALAVVALWSHRRARLDHSDLDKTGGSVEVVLTADTSELVDGLKRASRFVGFINGRPESYRAEIALRVRDRLGPAGDGEDTFAATLAEVESLVRLS